MSPTYFQWHQFKQLLHPMDGQESTRIPVHTWQVHGCCLFVSCSVVTAVHPSESKYLHIILMSKCSSNRADGKFYGKHSTDSSPSYTPSVWQEGSTNNSTTYFSLVRIFFL